MKKIKLSVILTMSLGFLMNSCSKDSNTSATSSVNPGPFPTTNSSPSTGLTKNTQPTGCGTYFPMFANAYYTFSKDNSATDTSHSKVLGRDTTINGQKYSLGTATSFGTTSTSFIRRSGSKIYSYSYLSPVPFEILLMDESKAIGESWDGGSFTLTNNVGGTPVTTVNAYSFKMKAKHNSYTLGTGLSFNDVLEVTLTVTTTVNYGSSTGTKLTSDGGSVFYAKCVGAIKTFTPSNTTIGTPQILQELKSYKM